MRRKQVEIEKEKAFRAGYRAAVLDGVAEQVNDAVDDVEHEDDIEDDEDLDDDDDDDDDDDGGGSPVAAAPRTSRW